MSAKKSDKNSAKANNRVIDKLDEHGLGKVVTVESESLLEVAKDLRSEGFDLFLFVSGVDYPEEIGLTYRLVATCKDSASGVFIKTKVSKDSPIIDSLTSVWPNASWHERETFDLFGVEFKGHPDMRRIFMPENWEGYPLRKDYTDNHMIVYPEYLKDQEKKAAAAEKSKVSGEEKVVKNKEVKEKAKDE